MIHAPSSDASFRGFSRRCQSFLKSVTGCRSSEPKIDGMTNAIGQSLPETFHHASRAMRRAWIDYATNF